MVTGASYWMVSTASRASRSSSFLVGPDAAYCAAAGFTDGRSISWTLTRPDGTVNFCAGRESGCEHTAHPFEVNAYANGVYRACIAVGSCGWISVDRLPDRPARSGAP